MGLFNFTSILFFIFTVILFFSSKKIGKTYLYFGIPTLIYVFIYGYLPAINDTLNGIPMFILFSLLIMLWGIFFGLLTYFIFRKNTVSIIASIVMSLIMIFVLFNVKGVVSYMYIPVLLVKVQEIVNGTLILQEKKPNKNGKK